MRLKRLETDIGSMVGGDGAIYAIRRELWRRLPDTAINDFLNPLQIVADGWRCVYEPEAVCYEAPTDSFVKEYSRRVRIVSRSWRAVCQEKAVLNPLRVGFFAVSIVSHKILRWLAGIFILAGSLSLGARAASIQFASPEWLPVVAFVAVLCSLALFRWFRIAASAAYFVGLQMAALVGVAYGVVGRVVLPQGSWTVV